ncbi:hypothetical protein STEG23_031550, partial [Scotinomys teguina]
MNNQSLANMSSLADFLYPQHFLWYVHLRQFTINLESSQMPLAGSNNTAVNCKKLRSKPCFQQSHTSSLFPRQKGEMNVELMGSDLCNDRAKTGSLCYCFENGTEEKQISRYVWSQMPKQTNGKRENQRIGEKYTGNGKGSSGP